MTPTRTARTIATPIAQALAEGLLTRRELKAFMRRRNGPALRRLLAWLALLAATGTLVWLTDGSAWQWPAMLLHGVVLVHHFSLQHECTHYTAFRTRWLNDVVAGVCGFSIGLAPRFFRYEHCDHHTFTQQPGKDPELIPQPRSWREYLLYLSSWPYWKAKAGELLRHAAGRISEADARFVPQVEHAAVILEARLLLGGYALVAAAAFTWGWTWPLDLWLVPLLLGEPVMRFIRMTEHVGRPAIADMRRNTRSNLVSWPWRFLCWNMNYHAEHHYAASVPFHALPALHERLRGHLTVEPGGYPGAHRELIRHMLNGAARPQAGPP